MEKSNTTNQDDIDIGIKYVIKYISDWSKKQLNELSLKNNGKLPIIAQIGTDSYSIGNYTYRKIDNFTWEISYKYSDFKKKLHNKKAGFFTTICYSIGKFNLAEKLADDDIAVYRLSNKVYFFESKIKKHYNDLHKYELYKARHYEYKLKLDKAKENLEKNINLTKYI